MTDANHSHHPFFVDGKRYESEKAHVTGLEIKTIANVESNYQLYLEEEGDKPDKAIKDNETISLADRVKHFFAVPPATFG